ncbi:MAG: hypothetical protein LBK61_03140 [Spirochaetaceae bacterium]|nr:hypothetical protein [Spirochaetaceae bacterium]
MKKVNVAFVVVILLTGCASLDSASYVNTDQSVSGRKNIADNPDNFLTVGKIIPELATGKRGTEYYIAYGKIDQRRNNIGVSGTFKVRAIIAVTGVTGKVISITSLLPYEDRSQRITNLIGGITVDDIYQVSDQENALKIFFPAFLKTTTNSGIEEELPNRIDSIITEAINPGSVKISWKPSSVAAKYNIYRAEGYSSDFILASTVNAPSEEYTDIGLDEGKRYQYKITLINNKNIESDFSEAGSISTKYSMPKAPTNIKATSKGQVIILTWDAIEENINYNVSIALDYNGPYVIITTTDQTAFYVTTLTPNSGVPLTQNTTYYFKISSIIGYNDNSAESTSNIIIARTGS